MAEQVTRIRVFVASPSDVTQERGILLDLVKELNANLGTSQGFFLEWVGWETHVYPELGEAQEVINRQIPPCDIFIGIMWSRFGTPTGRFGSGTEEEFQRAHERWQRGGSPKILFYFCDRPVSLVKQDQVEQANKVFAFRQSLEEKKVLVGKYPDSEAFRESVRRNLIQAVEDVLREGEPGDPPRFKVFVASVRDPLGPLCAELIEELNASDVEILRPSGDRADAAELITKAHLCIHLLDGTSHPIVNEQLDLSCQHAQQQLVWLSSRVELSPEDLDPHRRKLLELQSRGDENDDFMRGRNAAQEITERVKARKEEWLRCNSRGVFFNTHGQDKPLAQDVFDYLLSKNLEPLMNEDDRGEPSHKEFHEKAGQSRAIVVFFGTVNVEWVTGRLLHVQKMICSKRYPAEMKLGVYAAPPPKTSKKVPIRLPGGFVPEWMDNTLGFDPRTLDVILF